MVLAVVHHLLALNDVMYVVSFQHLSVLGSRRGVCLLCACACAYAYAYAFLVSPP